MVTLPDTRQSRQTHYGLPDRLLAGGLLLIPIIVFWYVWDRYAVNVPKWDDHVLKVLLFNLEKETSFSEKFYEFIRQHNEHRIVYDRLITWLDFTISGKLNYRHLMVVGNLSLLGLLLIFGVVLGRSLVGQNKNQSIDYLANGLVYLPPVAFLLLNLSQWENMFWGMAALQNFTVILWVFWAAYLLSFTRPISLPLLLAIAATLTSGNGLLIWPIGFAILLAQKIFRARSSYKPLVIWSIGAIVIIALYFWGYQKPPGNPVVKGSFVDLIIGWLAFNGAAGEAFPFRIVLTMCLLLGGALSVLVLGALLYILKKGLTQRELSSIDYFFAAATVFLLTTAATVAWGRLGFGMSTLITSRYKIYSLLLLALAYSYILVQTRPSQRKWVLRSGLLFSVVLMVSSYRMYLDEAISLRQYLLTKQFDWTYSTNRPISAIDPQTARILNNSPAFYDRILPDLYRPVNGSSVPFSSINKTGDSFVFTDTTAVTSIGPDAGTYILARSAKRIYLFPTIPTLTSSWKANIGLQDLFRKGISSSFSEAELDSATYQIERLIVRADGGFERHPTDQTITAAPQKRRDIQKNW
ncbi:hypothetical protein [Spirosoma validum]|uniref:Uncharacterized protein n=1 Tax=Spirosoma validum TaxID=2771355 RepID=A0A927B708_9BACT|nr:hypothetical protein [Spirosoma validum]MBD2756630.1 hypothetical protein [Spirosoma validum]